MALLAEGSSRWRPPPRLPRPVSILSPASRPVLDPCESTWSSEGRLEKGWLFSVPDTARLSCPLLQGQQVVVQNRQKGSCGRVCHATVPPHEAVQPQNVSNKNVLQKWVCHAAFCHVCHAEWRGGQKVTIEKVGEPYKIFSTVTCYMRLACQSHHVHMPTNNALREAQNVCLHHACRSLLVFVLTTPPYLPGSILKSLLPEKKGLCLPKKGVHHQPRTGVELREPRLEKEGQ